MVLHAALLFAVGRALPSEPEVVVAALDTPLVLDLRTTLAPPRAEARYVEARALPRSGVPDTRAVPLLDLESPLPAEFEIETETPLEHASSIPAAGTGGARVATTRLGRRREPSTLAAGPTPASAPAGAALTSGFLDLAPPDTAPVFSAGPQPEYPALSRRAGEEGDVHCRLYIDTDGSVSAVEVLISSGVTRLDEAARAALLTWRFEPATHAGAPIACTLSHTVRFRLH
ncbi:MAG: energy transducer TonB [Planctomycetes bacterium]|nr:energy transducer TonB [Planctomycetota bacterium]